MTMPAIARSSLRTSLQRYARSRGLWLMLLVAPVGARYMISDESGGGLAIAIGDHLPVLTSPVLGIWLGIIVSTLLLPVGYIYLRANVTRRQPWQVEEVSPGSRRAIMLGRFGADVAVLLGFLTALNLAGWVLGWMLVSGPYNPWQITLALWMVAAPALIGLAALRQVFDARPLLRRGWGDLLFVVLWMASIIMPASMQGQPPSLAVSMADFTGFYAPMVAGSPHRDDNFTIGGVDVKPGRVKLDAMAGLAAPGYAPSRALWIVLSVLAVLLAAQVYRPHQAVAQQRGPGRLTRWLDPGAPPPAQMDAPPARLQSLPFVRLAWAEARLIGAGRIFKVLALAAALAGLVPDYRHAGSPAALLLLAFALSAHAGRCEARRLLGLTGTAALGPMHRRIAFVLAGTGWAIALALPAALATVQAAPLALGAITGFAAALVAIGLASLTSSGFAARVVLLIGWYVYLST
ncbi:MAG: hypothetical protein IT549_12995 [Novosphingobium sp.]|nr:hypothetical protein [Novosphingobium sp.]